MIVILEPQLGQDSAQTQSVIDYLRAKPGISPRVHQVSGAEQTLTEIYLVGNTSTLDREEIENINGVARVVKVSRDYAVLGRHGGDSRSYGFSYNGVTFNQDNLNIFAGLCAVDNPQHVEKMMRAVSEAGLQCTRMGAYKPRTNPYSFQGHGADCLPWVFELAGKYGIKVIAMEITHDSHIEEINAALEQSGNATGVMLQIGTRNTQNFELLKACGKQSVYPVLLKRGFGITLEESLNAAEYLASEGNRNVIFCLRGMKTNMGDPHRNFVDFSHVPTIKRLTHMPVCIDPSHSVGTRDVSPDGVLELMHCTAQGVVSGANMVLVDFHPNPPKALVDGPQALTMNELDYFLQDIAIAREAYLKRRELVQKQLG
ncbi:MAG: 3-deoxy-7-phosphoheptulonate synthase [Gammaproteobacteria bacterium]|nr:3-deoxy-7-phosphoheptulonate synthase [Gammaproteobacteria bacterium]